MTEESENLKIVKVDFTKCNSIKSIINHTKETKYVNTNHVNKKNNKYKIIRILK